MATTGNTSRLRLVRIAGDSILKEKILPKPRLDKGLIDMIVRQMKGITEEMETEWLNDPGSAELGEAFHLLNNYLECLEGRAKGRA